MEGWPSKSECASASGGVEALPEELLIKIAQHLEPHDSAKKPNLRTLSLASKKWLACCNVATHTLSLSGLKASKLPRLLRRFPELKALNLSFLFDCSEDVLSGIGQHCPRLTHLHIPDNCKGAHGRGLAALTQGCPGLRVLALPAYKGPEAALLSLEQCPLLRVLKLKQTPNLTDAVVAHIARSCRLIQDLDLSFNGITDEALEAIGASLGGLTKLDLKHCKMVSGFGIAHIARGCPKLQHLHLGVVDMNDHGLIALGRCSRELQELSLDYGAGASPPFAQEAVAALAQGCPRLRVLSLRGSKQVDDTSLQGLAKGCPSLEELDLHACSKVGDAALQAIVRGCKKLRLLVLTGTAVGAAGASAFSGGLPALAVLRLNGELVANALLQSVGANCRALEELHLSSCLITDDGLESILRACSKLHTLTLKACPDVQGTAFAVGHCPALHTVQLPSCGVTDVGLAALGACAPSLHSLTLSFCLKLSPAGICSSISAFPSLASLVATGCSQLSRDHVLLLTKAAQPALKTLRVSRPGSQDDDYTLKRHHVGWSLPCWARGTLAQAHSAKF